MTHALRAFALFILLTAFTSLTSAAGTPVVVYENEACGHCQPYIGELSGGLASIGVTGIDVRPFINNESARAELARLQQSRGVPLEMQGHLVVSVDGGKFLFEGHVPVPLITDFLSKKTGLYPNGIVVTQDAMSGASTYKVFDGTRIEEFSISTPIGSGPGSSPQSSGNWFLPAAFVLIPVLLILLGGREHA